MIPHEKTDLSDDIATSEYCWNQRQHPKKLTAKLSKSGPMSKSDKEKGKETASPVRIGEYNVFPLQRGVDVLDLDGSTTSKIGLKNSSLVSLSDEFLDFSKEARLRVEKTGRDKKTGEAKTVREDIRVSRPNSRALLLIYFIDLYHATDVVEHKRISSPTLSISFPQSPNGKSIQVTTGLLEGLEDADFEEMDDE